MMAGGTRFRWTGMVFFLLFSTSIGQEQLFHPDTRIDRLALYLDCDICDFDFFRNQIRFVHFVRDPYQAQVHLLITHQKTASAGRQFTLRFIGRDRFKAIQQQMDYTSFQFDTEEQLRQGLVRTVKMGLMPYVSQTLVGSRLEIQFDEKKGGPVLTREPDAWKFWIFHIDFQGGLEAEENQNELQIGGSLRAEQTTEQWKIKTELDYEQERETYKDNEKTIMAKRREWEADVEWVKSMTRHWSAGFFGAFFSSSFRNIQSRIGGTAGFEYNVFPWDQSDRRICTVSWSAGIRVFHYEEVTLYNKLSETLPYGRLRAEVSYIQPWGEMDASIAHSHYYHDLSKNNLSLEMDFSLRLTKGLAFTISLEAESLHDQFYLPKGEATLQEILLKQRKLATSYDVAVRMGLRYSFGSIYNNIVNRRF